MDCRTGLGQVAPVVVMAALIDYSGPMAELNPIPLPAGIRSRYVDHINGLRMHILEAGYEQLDRPGVLLLHGFPELAYSWRNVMPELAEAGYHVIAPDQRGYGRTSGAGGPYNTDLMAYRGLNLVRDALGLTRALGYDRMAVVGHDFGSPVAAWCGIVRPDVFHRVVLMSAPFAGTPGLTESGQQPIKRADAVDLHDLDPPRRHYQAYYRTPEANENMWHAKQGVHAFLRAYYHMKSADWADNAPFPLASAAPQELAKMPTYYVMEADRGMAETVAAHMPPAPAIAENRWLSDSALSFYTQEYQRTGFQGGLNWYRAFGLGSEERELFAGRTLDQPVMFIAGQADWGIHQVPGAFEAMQTAACSDFRGALLLPDAGHWVQQEQAQLTASRLKAFLKETAA